MYKFSYASQKRRFPFYQEATVSNHTPQYVDHSQPNQLAEPDQLNVLATSINRLWNTELTLAPYGWWVGRLTALQHSANGPHPEP